MAHRCEWFESTQFGSCSAKPAGYLHDKVADWAPRGAACGCVSPLDAALVRAAWQLRSALRKRRGAFGRDALARSGSARDVQGGSLGDVHRVA